MYNSNNRNNSKSYKNHTNFKSKASRKEQEYAKFTAPKKPRSNDEIKNKRLSNETNRQVKKPIDNTSLYIGNPYGIRVQMMKKIKVGFVDIERKDGKTLTIRENDRNIPVETEIELVYARDGGKTFTVSTGSVFEIRGSKYRVLKLETKGGKPAVTVEDVAAKKQKIVQGA